MSLRHALAGVLCLSAVPALAQDVWILGEVYDNPAHHAEQAARVAAIQPRALVFEMLTPEQAARVTPDLLADPDAMAGCLAGPLATGRIFRCITRSLPPRQRPPSARQGALAWCVRLPLSARAGKRNQTVHGGLHVHRP